MRRMRLTTAFVALSVAIAGGLIRSEAQPQAVPAHDYPVRPVPFTAVQVTDQFWAPRIEINRTVTIPFAFGKNEETGRVGNFQRAAAVLQGHPPADLKPPGYPFDDTDIYKVLEGASYTLSVKPDPKLSGYLDGLIETIAAAQEKDGYLYTTRTIDPLHPHPWAGASRWVNETDLSHELYNLGHLYEAAVAHYQATGKRSLLDVAIRTADLLVATFGPGKQTIWPGHQITEMGLAKLYRVTGNEQYLSLAKFMLDVRGPGSLPRAGSTYNQSQARVVDQTEAVGHAVRATYMYSGMADVAALTGDQSYVHAIDRIWRNVVERKLYVTGGIGARDEGEAFGDDYELPNMSVYNETCAAVGNDYWNQRLFLLHGDGRYIDVLERTLYNGLLSGVSLDGKAFFYPNPLESNGQHERSPWFGVACCPGNITRFLPSMPGYIYARRGDSVYVNLFVGSTADIPLDAGHVRVTQDTRYPWDGDVRLTLAPAAPGRFTLRLRVPGWARNEASPGDLYRFADTVSRTGDTGGERSTCSGDAGPGLRGRDARLGRRRSRAAAPADAGAPRPCGRSSRRRSRPNRAPTRPDRLRGRMARQPAGARAQPAAERRCAARRGVPARRVERRRGDHGNCCWLRDGALRQDREARAAIHRDSVLRVGQPRGR